MILKPILTKLNLFADLIYHLIDLVEQQLERQQYQLLLQPVYDSTDSLLSQKEAAHLLRKDPRTIRRYVRAGILNQVMVANMPYYSKHEIHKLMMVPR